MGRAPPHHTTFSEPFCSMCLDLTFSQFIKVSFGKLLLLDSYALEKFCSDVHWANKKRYRQW